MRARSRVEVAPGGVLAHVSCAPPLTVRRVRAEAPDVVALCLVGSAAGPLPGDDLELTTCLAAGAVATLRATGASIATGASTGSGAGGDGRPGRPPARLRFSVDVGPGACLDADPGALVLTAGADVVVDVCLEVAPDATLVWSETVVLGRTGERPGRALLRWDVRRGGRPLLRQDVDLADDLVRAWPGTLAGARTLTTTLHVGPGVDARTQVRGPADVTQRLAEGATLTTVLR